ncbi:MAG: S-methyl-5-thioribose kinase [Propionibacteriaceae bacterium]|nr:S-methyl-5-thioribose kinase [Propionibacteriaceae bacterium]
MANYEFLTTDTIGAYIASKPELASRIDAANLVRLNEIGDGNLNLVFLVKDSSGRGMCLKQALPYVRLTGEGWPMTPDRARHEAESIQAHHALVPELLPEIFLFDEPRHIIAMEDLSDHQVWRTALNLGERDEGAAAAMGRYMASYAFGTSLFAMDREALSEAIARTQNPQICTITEDLIFTEPVVDAGRNEVLPANQRDAVELSSDPQMMAAMGEAKWTFMTHAEALIHGDLHTGSVMVRCPDGSTTCDSVKAFDSEFAFYGPVAFDIGILLANYVLAAARAYALGEDDRAAWCLNLIAESWQGFETEFRRLWPSRIDPRVWGDDFLDALLDRWGSETWLFAACELSRRIVGLAKTSDIETLSPDLREGAVRGALQVARALVRKRHGDHSPQALIDIAASTLQANRTN